MTLRVHTKTVERIYHELETAYTYLQSLNDFLSNVNELWLEAVRAESQHSMTVECTMGQHNKVSTIYIRFGKNDSPSTLRTDRMYSSSCTYLAQMGIMTLRLRRKLDFVVGVSTGKYTRPLGGGHSAVPTYDQAHICGRAYKLPTAETSNVSESGTWMQFTGER
jgi:hypothetical protein